MRPLRLSPRAYQRITLLALIAVGFIIVTGAAVRLSGSGLGCSDWPTCEQNQFVASVDFHPMIEFGNRVITGLVSVSVILAVLGSLVRTPRRRDLTWWSLGLVGGVIAQIILGAVVVKLGLTPVSVIGHFLVSMVLVWNGVVLHERACTSDKPAVVIVPRPVINLSRLMVAATVAVLVAGTVVTATGPHGGDETAERLGFDISTVARLHAILVWALLVITLLTLWGVHRSNGSRATERRGQVLVGAILVQGAIGYTQYFSGVPPWMVGLHVLGSVVVWISVLRFHLGLFVRPAEVTEVEPVLRAAAPDLRLPAS